MIFDKKIVSGIWQIFCLIAMFVGLFTAKSISSLASFIFLAMIYLTEEIKQAKWEIQETINEHEKD